MAYSLAVHIYEYFHNSKTNYTQSKTVTYHIRIKFSLHLLQSHYTELCTDRYYRYNIFQWATHPIYQPFTPIDQLTDI